MADPDADDAEPDLGFIVVGPHGRQRAAIEADFSPKPVWDAANPRLLRQLNRQDKRGEPSQTSTPVNRRKRKERSPGYSPSSPTSKRKKGQFSSGHTPSTTQVKKCKGRDLSPGYSSPTPASKRKKGQFSSGHTPSVTQVKKRKKKDLSPEYSSPAPASKRKKGQFSSGHTFLITQVKKRKKKDLSPEPEDAIVVKRPARAVQEIEEFDKDEVGKTSPTNSIGEHIKGQIQSSSSSQSSLPFPGRTFATPIRPSRKAICPPPADIPISDAVEKLNPSDENVPSSSNEPSYFAADEASSFSQDNALSLPVSGNEKLLRSKSRPKSAQPKPPQLKELPKTPLQQWTAEFEDLRVFLLDHFWENRLATSAFFPTSKKVVEYEAASQSERRRLDNVRDAKQQQFLRWRLALLADVIHCGRRLYREREPFMSRIMQQRHELRPQMSPGARRNWDRCCVENQQYQTGLMKNLKGWISHHKFYVLVEEGMKLESPSVVPQEVSEEELEIYDPGEGTYEGDYEHDELPLPIG